MRVGIVEVRMMDMVADIFSLQGKKVEIYWQGDSSLKPVILLNTFSEEGKEVFHLLQQKTRTSFSLAAISGLNWKEELSPWPCVPWKGAEKYKGRAQEYLAWLTDTLCPAMDARQGGKAREYWIAGYSMAGLFAIDALFHTSKFLRAASASGSFWYPGFSDFVRKHDFCGHPQGIFFSLGRKEAKAGPPILRTVATATQDVIFSCREKAPDVRIAFSWNQGNYFYHSSERMADLLCQMLEFG